MLLFFYYVTSGLIKKTKSYVSRVFKVIRNILEKGVILSSF